MNIMVKENIKLENNKKVVEKSMKNEITLEFDAISVNEAFARVVVAAFASSLDPTLEELSDVKTAVSEAVTNAIIHGYDNVYSYENQYTQYHVSIEDGPLPKINKGKIILHCFIDQGVLHIDIEDFGHGIANIEEAMEPLFTTRKEEERSGMGFSFMEAFMDDLEVESSVGIGTKIHMTKKFGSGPWILENNSKKE